MTTNHRSKRLKLNNRSHNYVGRLIALFMSICMAVGVFGVSLSPVYAGEEASSYVDDETAESYASTKIPEITTTLYADDNITLTGIMPKDGIVEDPLDALMKMLGSAVGDLTVDSAVRLQQAGSIQRGNLNPLTQQMPPGKGNKTGKHHAVFFPRGTGPEQGAGQFPRLQIHDAKVVLQDTAVHVSCP